MPRVPIPTKPFEEETPILMMGPISISLRQSLTLVISGMLWVMAMKVTTALLPINLIFGLLIFLWIPIIGIFLAFVTKDGRPYEEHLTKIVIYFISERNFIATDPRAKLGNVEDAQWEELDDDDDYHISL